LGINGRALKLKLLGRFEAWLGDEPISQKAWGRRKTQALLKVLLCQRGEIITQDRLIETLFPDLEPKKAVQNLHGRVSELRKVLEPNLEKGSDSIFIRSAGKGKYYFCDQATCTIDLEEFETSAEEGFKHFESGEWLESTERFKKTLELYKGDFLTEDLYEEWSIESRNRLRALYLEALSNMAHAHANMRGFIKSVEYCDKILSLEPLNEQAYRQKMLYLYRGGEKADALKTFEACRTALIDNLQVEPALETVGLHKSICENSIYVDAPAIRTRKLFDSRNRHKTSSKFDSPANPMYQRGIFFLNRQSAVDARKALSCFREAVKKDSKYAPAYSGLADAFSQLMWFNDLTIPEGYPKATWAVDQAIKLDDRLATAHVSKAIIHMNYDWDGERAMDELDWALELDPNCAIAYRYYAGLMAVRGEFSEGLELIEKAVKLDPLSFHIGVAQVWILYLSKQFHRAIDVCLSTLELDPNLVRARSLLGLSYAQVGRIDEAIEQLQQAVHLSQGNPTEASALGYLYGRVEERNKALRILESFESGRNGKPVPRYHKAVIHLGLQEEDRAIDQLHKAWQEGCWMSIFTRTEPRFQKLMSHPKYAKMHQQIWDY
jgi:DNA-binding SARP family transcriptional activator